MRETTVIRNDPDASLVFVLSIPAAEKAGRLEVENSADGEAARLYFVDDSGKRWPAELVVVSTSPTQLVEGFRANPGER